MTLLSLISHTLLISFIMFEEYVMFYYKFNVQCLYNLVTDCGDILFTVSFTFDMLKLIIYIIIIKCLRLVCLLIQVNNVWYIYHEKLAFEIALCKVIPIKVIMKMTFLFQSDQNLKEISQIHSKFKKRLVWERQIP